MAPQNELVTLDDSAAREANLDDAFSVCNPSGDLDISWIDPNAEFNTFLYSSSLFVHDIVLDDSLVISGDEYQILSHYQRGFSSSRLLKTPRWSTYGCILHSVSHIPMAMHLLIAISSMDLNRRSPRSAVSQNVSRAHFRKGSEMLMHLMNVNTEPHHFSTLVSWLFVSLCMGQRDVLDKKAINQLITAILKYIQRYNLDTLSAGRSSNDMSLASSRPTPFESTEAGLIGRVILFLAASDLFMAFEGCGGQLSKHVYANKQMYWGMFSQQRFVLERYWGASYPEYEMLHDLETTAAMEMGYKVAHIFHLVNELSENSPQDALAGDPEIERQIADIEAEYSSILRITRSPAASRGSFQQTANIAVSAFYFVQIYYFRLTLDDPTKPAPPHITLAMTDTMNIVHQAFSEQEMWGHELYQLPLFLVGIETRDRIHGEWILSKMSRWRFRLALSEIRSTQEKTGSRLSVAHVRRILEAPSRLDALA